MSRTWLIVGLGLAGCDQQQTEMSVTTSDVLYELEGAWLTEVTIGTNCPTEYRRFLPSGNTSWTVQDEQLHIQDRPGTQNILLWPMQDSTFFNRNTITVHGCEITEELTLFIDENTNFWANGQFISVLHHDGSNLCSQLANEMTLPDRCENETTWRARKLNSSQ